MLNLDSPSPRVFSLSPAGMRTVRLSPDVQHTAVASFAFGDFVNSTTDDELSLYKRDGTVLPKLSDVAFVNFGAASQISHAEIEWSPDSNFVVYLRHDPDAPPNMQVMLYRPATAENFVLLADLPKDDYGFALSSDGQSIAIFSVHHPEPNSLYLVSADGKHAQLVSDQLAEFPQGQWSADGKMFGFLEASRGGMAAKIVAQDGTNLRQLTSQSIEALLWTDCR
jgi:Tol biopolymer transport system component